MTVVKLAGDDDARQAPSPPTGRVVKIMGLLADGSSRSLTEISRALDISRPTAHAILATLTRHRWAIRDDQTSEYSLGPAVAALARAAGDRPWRGELQDLHTATGMPVILARREGDHLTVIDHVGDSAGGPNMRAEFRMPLIAPFGRDYVAWSDASDQQAWLAPITPSADALRERLLAVLAEIRRRGVVIERLTPECVRVYTALQALDSADATDPITTRLAHAFADLTLVDYLPGELGRRRTHPIATVAAPIRDRSGAVVMSVGVAPFSELSGSTLTTLSDQLCAAAARIQEAM